MKTRTLMVLGILSASLSACGVRDEPLDGDGSASQTSTVSTTTGSAVGTSTDNTAISVQGSATGDEFTGVAVELKFIDDYTGFWENEDRSNTQTTEIVRLTYGENFYHIQSFYDQSSGVGSLNLNCYLRELTDLTNLYGEGLRTFYGIDETVEYQEWTLEGTRLKYTVYDFEGEVAETISYKSVFEGLPVASLQICI